jgi:ATP-dependent helicase/nuclease subunit A
MEGREIRADSLFTHVTRDSMELGQAIHELFEKVSWIDEVDIENLIRGMAGEPLASLRRSKGRGAVPPGGRLPEVRQALSRPEGDVLLWREKHFEIVLEDQWITGVFDRVTIRQDPDGRPLQATILDYKSNEITGDADLAATAEYYRPQLLLYGRALSRMLQIDPPDPVRAAHAVTPATGAQPGPDYLENRAASSLMNPGPATEHRACGGLDRYGVPELGSSGTPETG